MPKLRENVGTQGEKKKGNDTRIDTVGLKEAGVLREITRV